MIAQLHQQLINIKILYMVYHVTLSIQLHKFCLFILTVQKSPTQMFLQNKFNNSATKMTPFTHCISDNIHLLRPSSFPKHFTFQFYTSLYSHKLLCQIKAVLPCFPIILFFQYALFSYLNNSLQFLLEKESIICSEHFKTH